MARSMISVIATARNAGACTEPPMRLLRACARDDFRFTYPVRIDVRTYASSEILISGFSVRICGSNIAVELDTEPDTFYVSYER